MNQNPTELKTRRTLMKQAVKIIIGIAALPLLETIRDARADGKLAKADVNYRDKSNTGKDCDDCQHFIPGATANDYGTCKVVDGVVSPHGYCAAFTRKPIKAG